MSSIFISHSAKDHRSVEELVKFLQQNNIDTWYASNDIETAAEFKEEILAGLRKSDWFLVLMSPNSLKSEWVVAEVDWALKNRPGRLIPVMLETCDVVEFDLRLSKYQYVDLRKKNRTSLIKITKIIWKTERNVAALYKKACENTKEKDFDAARENLNALLEIDPDHEDGIKKLLEVKRQVEQFSLKKALFSSAALKCLLLVLILIFIGIGSYVAFVGKSQPDETVTVEEGRYFGKVDVPTEQVLNYFAGDAFGSLDITQHENINEREKVYTALFDGLCDYDSNTSTVIPSLAEKWETNENANIWRFHLRRNTQWSDGKSITANDFVFSWRRLLSPKSMNPYKSYLYYIKNADAFAEEKAFVKDPVTGFYAIRQGEGIGFVDSSPTDYSSYQPENSILQKSKQLEDFIVVPNDPTKLEKYLNDSTYFPASFKEVLKNKKLVPVREENVGIRSLDDYTLEVILEYPAVYFPDLVVHSVYRPIPRHIVQQWGDGWTSPEHIVTSGPFKLASKDDKKLVVERNSLFWDNSTTKLDRIVFWFGNHVSALNLYKSGSIDFLRIGSVSKNTVQQLNDKDDFIPQPTLGIEYLSINTRKHPTNKLLVRRALNMSIDREEISKLTYGALPLTELVPPMEGYTSPKGEGHNPHEARRLLAEAGYPGGRGFPTIELWYNRSGVNKEIANSVRSMLQDELKIKTTLIEREFKEFLIAKAKLEYNGLARDGWFADYNDPTAFLDMFISNGPDNRTGWQNSQYDALISEARFIMDPAKRLSVLKKAEECLLADQPIIPLLISTQSFLRKPYVKGLSISNLGYHNWKQVFIDSSFAKE